MRPSRRNAIWVGGFRRPAPRRRSGGEATSGPEAVRLLRETQPDIVFLDVHLPGGDAFHVLDRSSLAIPPATAARPECERRVRLGMRDRPLGCKGVGDG